ncbi:MAG: hypothetical protein L0207_02865 [Chlamydiae bacterium]|nr:hypothetical protein [Chlamydiota bacterium]
MNCPLCQRITPIPIRYSAEQISDLVTTFRKVDLIMRSFSGAIVGFGIGLTIKETFHISIPLPTFPIVLGGFPFLQRLFDPAHDEWINRSITSIYNWFHATNIHPDSVWLYQKGLHNFPSNEQRLIALRFGIKMGLSALLSILKSFPIEEDEKKIFKPLFTWFNQYREQLQNEEVLANEVEQFGQYLTDFFPDLFIKIKKIGSHLLEENSNLTLKDNLQDAILNYFISKMKLEAINNHDLSIRIAVINSLEFAKRYPFKIPSNESFLNAWQTLLTNFQKECREPNSRLISELMQNKELKDVSFSNLSLPELLCDIHFSNYLVFAVYMIRKTQFQEVIVDMDLY